MKKFLSLLYLLLCLFAFVSCKKSGSKEPDKQSEVIDNQKEVDEFKALLNKQDLSPFY